MRIAIDTEVADDRSSHRWLNQIVHKIDDGWHVWELTGLEEFESTLWLQGTGTHADWLRELLISSVRRSAYPLTPHSRSLRVSLDDTGADQVTPEQAARLTAQPLTILVEDRESDGAFVHRVLHELDRHVRAFWSERPERIEFDSRGGKDSMWKEVKSRMARSDARPRLVVVVDSDRRGPSAEASQASRRLAKLCERHDIPCWVLAKREAENYLPAALLERRADTPASYRDRVACWDGLTDEQKDFFDMKHGLQRAPSATEEELYRCLGERARTLLAHGFGDKVWNCWNEWRSGDAGAIRTRGGEDLVKGIALIRGEI